MGLMCRLRRRRASLSRPDLRLVRTLQAPEQLVFDEPSGLWQFSSAAFRPSSSDGCLSVDIEELLEADGLTVLTLYGAIDRAVGSATFTVREALDLGLTVEHQPVSKNWYHGGVRGIVSSKNSKLKKKARQLVEIDQAAAQRYHDEKLARARSAAASAPVSF